MTEDAHERASTDPLEEAEGSLSRTAATASAALLATILVCFLVVKLWNDSRPDQYVVDFYPQTPERDAQVVFRWPSRGLQLDPIPLDVSKLPETVRDRWGGNRPKRSKLTAETILPAGRVIESDTRVPPGRFVVAIGRQRLEVNPEAEWRGGSRP